MHFKVSDSAVAKFVLMINTHMVNRVKLGGHYLRAAFSGLNTVFEFHQLTKNPFSSVGNLPKDMEGSSRMSPTPAGDNVLLIYENKIFTLSIYGSSYVWLEKPQELSIYRTVHLQFTLPASLISACTLTGRVFCDIFQTLCLCAKIQS